MNSSLIGSLATAITISSFLFKDVKTIRIVNLLGCFVWLLYGWMQSDTPIILVNSIIAFIHIVTLVKESLK